MTKAPPAGSSGRSGDSRVLELPPARVGGRLDLFLADELGLSRAQVRRLLESGAVSLDGRLLMLRDKGRPLPQAGQLVVKAFRPSAEQRVLPEEPASDGRAPGLIARGPGWLAIDKPAGMPVHPLRESERATALGHVIARHPEIHGVGEGGLRSGVVHRLDVETSGVLLFATEQTVWRRLREAFHGHRVEKRYRALVQGVFDPPGGELELELPLIVARHRPAHVRVASPEETARGRARLVRQLIRGVEPLRGASLVEIQPQTGFLHQIRVSLAHLGHPVLGDRRYGARENPPGQPFRVERHLLHAASLRFEEVAAEAPDPGDFVTCLERLR